MYDMPILKPPAERVQAVNAWLEGIAADCPEGIKDPQYRAIEKYMHFLAKHLVDKDKINPRNRIALRGFAATTTIVKNIKEPDGYLTVNISPKVLGMGNATNTMGLLRVQDPAIEEGHPWMVQHHEMTRAVTAQLTERAQRALLAQEEALSPSLEATNEAEASRVLTELLTTDPRAGERVIARCVQEKARVVAYKIAAGKASAEETAQFRSLLSTPPDGRNVVIHRLGGEDLPPMENTLEAFNQTIALGLPVARTEFDIFMSRDGIAAVGHPRVVEQQLGVRSQTSWEEIQQRQFPTGERVPALAEVVAFAATNSIPIQAEIKDETAAPEVVRILGEQGMGAQTLVTSFSADALRTVKELQGDLCTGWLLPTEDLDALFQIDADGNRQVWEVAQAAGVSYIGPRAEQLLYRPDAQQIIREAHQRGIQVYTFHTPSELVDVVWGLGVDDVGVLDTIGFFTQDRAKQTAHSLLRDMQGGVDISSCIQEIATSIPAAVRREIDAIKRQQNMLSKRQR